MPWFFQHETTRYAGDEPFFSHIFYQDMKPASKLYDQAIYSILKNLNAGLVYNVRGNLYYNNEKKNKSARHTDVEYQGVIGKTSILYINTNNGGTKLYPKGEKSVFINSVANRLVTYSSIESYTAEDEQNPLKILKRTEDMAENNNFISGPDDMYGGRVVTTFGPDILDR